MEPGKASAYDLYTLLTNAIESCGSGDAYTALKDADVVFESADKPYLWTGNSSTSTTKDATTSAVTRITLETH